METKTNAAASLLAKYQRQIKEDGESVRESVLKFGTESINEINNYTDCTENTDSNVVTLTRSRARTHEGKDEKHTATRNSLIRYPADVGKLGTVGIAIENKDENPTDKPYQLVPTPTTRSDIAKMLFDQLDEPLRQFGDFPTKRWEQFVIDARQFVGSHWYQQAKALGWSITDLFGANPIKPYARIDQMGAVLLLNGCQIAAMTDTSITITTQNGATLRIRKTPA